MRDHARGPRSFVALSIVVGVAACAAPQGEREDGGCLHESRGPIPERSNGPLAQTFLVLRPRTAETVAPGALQLHVESAYSSIFEAGTGTLGSVSFDGELWRTSAMIRTGLGSRTDFEVEVPVLYATSGFLDVFILTWHSVLGLPDSGRENRPEFDYDMQIESVQAEAYELEGDHLGLCDVPLVVTHRFVDTRGASPAIFASAALELPVGSEDSGFGNGSLDWGLALGLESRIGGWVLGGGLGWTDRQRSSSFARAGLEVDDGIAAHASAEWRAHEDWSVLAGLRFENAVSKSLGIEELGGEVLELDLGLALDGCGTTRWLAGFSEDLISASGPDFTAFLGFQVAF